MKETMLKDYGQGGLGMCYVDKHQNVYQVTIHQKQQQQKSLKSKFLIIRLSRFSYGFSLETTPCKDGIWVCRVREMI